MFNVLSRPNLISNGKGKSQMNVLEGSNTRTFCALDLYEDLCFTIVSIYIFSKAKSECFIQPQYVNFCLYLSHS
jgi:hypothetical protein